MKRDKAAIKVKTKSKAVQRKRKYIKEKVKTAIPSEVLDTLTYEPPTKKRSRRLRILEDTDDDSDVDELALDDDSFAIHTDLNGDYWARGPKANLPPLPVLDDSIAPLELPQTPINQTSLKCTFQG